MVISLRSLLRTHAILSIALTAACTSDETSAADDNAMPAVTSTFSGPMMEGSDSASSDTGDPATTSGPATTDDTSPTSSSATADDTGSGEAEVAVDGDGCATGIENLTVLGNTVNVTFQQGTFFDVFAPTGICDVTIEPYYYNDPAGAEAAARAVADLLNATEPSPRCVGDNTVSDVNYLVASGCEFVADLNSESPLTMTTRYTDPAGWTFDEDRIHAPIGASSPFLYATFSD